MGGMAAVEEGGEWERWEEVEPGPAHRAADIDGERAGRATRPAPAPAGNSGMLGGGGSSSRDSTGGGGDGTREPPAAREDTAEPAAWRLTTNGL